MLSRQKHRSTREELLSLWALAKAGITLTIYMGSCILKQFAVLLVVKDICGWMTMMKQVLNLNLINVEWEETWHVGRDSNLSKPVLKSPHQHLATLITWWFVKEEGNCFSYWCYLSTKWYEVHTGPVGTGTWRTREVMVMAMSQRCFFSEHLDSTHALLTSDRPPKQSLAFNIQSLWIRKDGLYQRHG